MEKIIKAKFLNGLIEPLEKVELKEGEEITITIKETPSETRKTIEALRKSFGVWKETVDCEKLKRDIYEDRLIRTRPEPKL